MLLRKPREAVRSLGWGIAQKYKRLDLECQKKRGVDTDAKIFGLIKWKDRRPWTKTQIDKLNNIMWK